MNVSTQTCFWAVRGLFLAGLVFSLQGLAEAQVKCSQEHPGRQHRLESVTKRGDARMTGVRRSLRSAAASSAIMSGAEQIASSAATATPVRVTARK